MLTPADSIAGLSSEDVALNGRQLAMVGASGTNPTLPQLPARAREGSELSLPGLTFGFFGKQRFRPSTSLDYCSIHIAALSSVLVYGSTTMLHYE
jgi:hypothetical protein